MSQISHLLTDLYSSLEGYLPLSSWKKKVLAPNPFLLAHLAYVEHNDETSFLYLLFEEINWTYFC